MNIPFKFKMLVTTGVLAASIAGLSPSSHAQQPYSSYWYPKDLLTWNSSQDKDAKFNRGSIPLADRFSGQKVNPKASVDPKVMALSIMNPHTSNTPSQGSNEFNTFTFGYWQYVDKLITWGGSAGEGIIVPPSADVIDAGHKNGVPVLGTIFFPPTVYGGKYEWVKEFMQQKPDGTFPVADKLLEVANYYGFDGWFINQETEGGTPEDALQMQTLIQYMKKHQKDNMQIVWYDSMTNKGNIDWQNALTNSNQMFLQNKTETVADNMFLNFWWRDMQASRDKAIALGRSPYDLYAGIDVQANGYDTKVSWDGLFPGGTGNHAKVSLGLYAPDWTFSSSKTHDEYYMKENKFWVGPNGTPNNTETTDAWKGISNYVVEQSAINHLPFSTHFNTGNGHFFSVNGQWMTEEPWSNRSLQDILPTWRWMTESKGTALKPSIDFTTAYYGGSSLKVAGTLNTANATNVQLYKTDLLAEKNTELAVTYHTPFKSSNIKVGITFADAPDQIVYLDAGKTEENKWTTKKLSLNQYAGKRISSLSLYFSSDTEIADYKIHIGELSVYNTNNANKLPAVSNLNINETDFKEGIYTDARLIWDKLDADVQHYEVYRVLPSGQKEWLGATANNAYYVQQMKRDNKEDRTTLEVVAVNKQYQQGQRTQVHFDWPKYPKPVAKFTSDTFVIMPGGKVTFTDLSSEVTEQRLWSFPGGTPLSSTDKNPTVYYDKEGIYPVTLTATNSAGQDVNTQDSYINVTTDEIALARNIAVGKTTTASSFVSKGEAPEFAVDGKVTDNSKWCAVGSGPHWLTVDLGSSSRLKQFVIKHAETGGEGASVNTSDFTIEVSEDGKTWSEVVHVQGNTKAETTHSIPVTNARYAKLTVLKGTQGGDSAARIYEFEVHGVQK
ncbi:MAG TPA: discoidin domain-containing protein [Paenibacillus sp.]